MRPILNQLEPRPPVSRRRSADAFVPRTDWRGWIALAWVVFWGSAYALMAIQARAPQLLQWLSQLTRKTQS